MVLEISLLSQHFSHEDTVFKQKLSDVMQFGRADTCLKRASFTGMHGVIFYTTNQWQCQQSAVTNNNGLICT